MRVPDWVLRKIAALPETFTGKIEWNCFEGGVSNLNVGQSWRETDDAVVSGK